MITKDDIEAFEFDILDDDGYPTEPFLTSIETWDYKRGFNQLLEFAMQGHIYPEYWQREKELDQDVWYIATGGWSGNEAILCALKSNTIFWLSCWYQSKRGGHFVFKVRKT